MRSFEEQRNDMVRKQIRARGVVDPRVLEAMREVPREEFVPERLREFAYNDSALPIEAQQTISQPLIVAQMAEALRVGPGDRVLDVGTGSGYAAAVLSRMVDRVFTVERHEELLRLAEERFRRLGYDNIVTLFSDGSLGWEEHAPYDGITVAAAGPEVPEALKRQLAVGGRLVIPVQRGGWAQDLLCITRIGEDEFRENDLGAVQFVPLVGVEGYAEPEAHGRTTGSPAPVGRSGRPGRREGRGGSRNGGLPPDGALSARGGRGALGSMRAQAPGRDERVRGRGEHERALEGGRSATTTSYAEAARATSTRTGTSYPAERMPAPTTYPSKPLLGEVIRWNAEPFDDIEDEPLDALLDRIGDARVVLLGEASHGTSEFYRMRARITKELIHRKNFKFVVVEADWPDAARIDHYARDLDVPPAEWEAFARFPTWMWRNEEMREFVDWLHDYNIRIADPDARVGFHGLDLYSLYTSVHSVLEYLEEVDPEAARIARIRYGCLTPWEGDPATYGAAAISRSYQGCADQVTAMLGDLLSKRLEYMDRDGTRWFDAVQNARLVRNAERYYRIMYYGSVESWNLRDQHMFDTLKALLEHWGPESKAVVWAHNSHLGDASATAMGGRGEHNVGQLCRREWGKDAYLVGFGTHTGTVAAAHEWDGDMQYMRVRPSHEGSYEYACHRAETPRFLLPLRPPDGLRQRLLVPRLERAIGVIYRPESELLSHYFQAVLPRQFDEWIWFDETEAVTPLSTLELGDVPDTYPFGV